MKKFSTSSLLLNQNAAGLQHASLANAIQSQTVAQAVMNSMETPTGRPCGVHVADDVKDLSPRLEQCSEANTPASR